MVKVKPFHASNSTKSNYDKNNNSKKKLDSKDWARNNNKSSSNSLSRPPPEKDEKDIAGMADDNFGHSPSPPSKQMKAYIPSEIESYFLEHGISLGLHDEHKPSRGCSDWRNTTSPIAPQLASFTQELKVYQEKVRQFNGTVKDLRAHLGEDKKICDTLELHPEGLQGIFPSGSLSHTNHLLEPLFPPMRNPQFCFQSKALMSLGYLVHDFASYCRSLKPESRIIFLDMGASLDFHGDVESPAVYLTNIYERFGFHWDHIFAYEVTQKNPEDVFERVPQDLLHAYHWINVGVSSDPESKMNPWNMLLRDFNKDDFSTCKRSPYKSMSEMMFLLVLQLPATIPNPPSCKSLSS
jgi:hypothetical protein